LIVWCNLAKNSPIYETCTLKKKEVIHAYKLMVGNNNHILWIALISTDVVEGEY